MAQSPGDELWDEMFDALERRVGQVDLEDCLGTLVGLLVTVAHDNGVSRKRLVDAVRQTAREYYVKRRDEAN